MTYNIDWLINSSKTKAHTYTFFWGASNKNGYLSQHYVSPFFVAGRTYLTAEHYMMAEKARLFGDKDIEIKIMTTINPVEAKRYGRTVKNFQENVWLENRIDIVTKANIEKFRQNPPLRDHLIKTGNDILVEASPYDVIWGSGLVVGHLLSKQPNKWRGQNLLGFILMNVRDILNQ